MLAELILAMVVSAAPPAGPPGRPAPLPQAITTRQTAFTIPFRIQGAPPAGQAPAEVQLYVSTDRGATWQLHSRVDPQQGRFSFRAGGDGEYWFLMRTMDRSGQLRPQGDARPGLCVIVDTAPPKLQFEARAVEGGRLMARWRIEDSSPNLDSLKIQYRTSPIQPWQPVAISRSEQAGPPRPGEAPSYAGEAVWLAQAADERVEIRAEVADMAGNPAVSHAQVDSNMNQASMADRAPPPIALPVSAQNAARVQRTPPVEPDWRSSQAMFSAVGLPGQGHAPVPHDHPAMSRDTPPNDTPGPSLPANTNGTQNAGPVTIQLNPAIRRQYGASAEPSGQLGPAIPPGVRPRMVNSRVFQLDYNVDAVGPSGIAKVELWGTRDGGRTWNGFNQDGDRRSPIVATVNEDGLYGFRICVQNGVGLGNGPPQSGQTPDIWIGVDRTKPEIHILSAEQGSGEQAGRVLIRWEARDWMLSARPVSLYYGATMGGPWTLIVGGLESAGQYNWLVEGRVPERIFLRAEARDEAGNLGIFETPQPVVLDKLRPSVRIQEVRPVGM